MEMSSYSNQPVCARQTGDSLPGPGNVHLRELTVRKASCGRCVPRLPPGSAAPLSLLSVFVECRPCAPPRPFPGRDVHRHLLIPRRRQSRDRGLAALDRCAGLSALIPPCLWFTSAILHPVCCQIGPDSSLFFLN